MTEASEKMKSVRGSMTAMVTPFRGGEVDWPCVTALVDRQVEGGVDWLVPLGTTGESPTLTSTERERLLETVISHTAGRCPVMAGTGTNNTAEAIRLTQSATSAGADAVLVVAPCYNRPTPEGLFRHFAKVAESTDLPIVLYNVPARTGVSIGNDVVVRLRKTFPNVTTLKDATGKVDHVTDLLTRCDIDLLSGDDALTWPFMALGGVGVISVVGNLCPALMKSLVTAATSGRYEETIQVHRKVYDLAMGIGGHGPNPLPIKSAMAMAGLLEEEFRLPLCPLEQAAKDGIAQVLRRHEIEITEPVGI